MKPEYVAIKVTHGESITRIDFKAEQVHDLLERLRTEYSLDDGWDISMKDEYTAFAANITKRRITIDHRFETTTRDLDVEYLFEIILIQKLPINTLDLCNNVRN